jgi:hypothetical protein
MFTTPFTRGASEEMLEALRVVVSQPREFLAQLHPVALRSIRAAIAGAESDLRAAESDEELVDLGAPQSPH